MRRRTLTELASNPDLISGIYNYCDRWCERCPLTSRCLVYATEQEGDNGTPENHDINNEAFWRKLSNVFQETKEMIIEWANEAGVDLSAITDEDYAETEKRKRRKVDNHSLAKAEKYANAASDWFRELDQTIEISDLRPTDSDREQSDQLEDAREVIQWYQYQVAVKTMRALSSLMDEEHELDEELGAESYPKDSDGSAKVALIGCDRSIAAWRLMQLALPERSDSIVPLILQLEHLRQRIERKFSAARGFVRPGFDEILGEAN